MTGVASDSVSDALESLDSLSFGGGFRPFFRRDDPDGIGSRRILLLIGMVSARRMDGLTKSACGLKVAAR